MLGEISLTGLTNQGQLTAQLNAWKVGQILEAVALSRPTAERLQLKIGGMELEARTQAPIQVGDRVTLKVLSVGDTPTLQVVPATTASANASDVVNHAIRQLLPRQTSTPKVVTSLITLLNEATVAGQGQEALPARAKGLIETLLARIPTAEKLANQAQLKQLVDESGLFRESRQLVGRPDQYDMKQALIQLARQFNALAQQRVAQQGALRQPQGPLSESQQPMQRGQSELVGSRASLAQPSSVAQTTSSGSTVPPSTPVKVDSTIVTQTAVQATTQAASQQTTGVTSPAGPLTGDAGLKSAVVQTGQQPSVQQPALSPAANQQAIQRAAAGYIERPDLLPFDELLLEARQAVEGGIARLIFQQAQSLPQQGLDGLRWVLELPYRDGDEIRSLPLTIEREAKRGDSDAEELGWRVELECQFEPLGSVQARVLVRGDKVSASLWAEQPETAELAETALPALETALIAAGLEVGALACLRGRRQDRPQSEWLGQAIVNYRV